ncbi:hypothetical protein KTT_25820 [Tengunoibacter tsumagoiensis]|uniref:Uncharacterized protein n=2 Tax=Tengunoibacter tsumagoiensis TaxID=2014871 RepID=A0A402A0T0_9CHLR|nr:hypothetical protein KTT_25820 [Tengunoibacter tsumagoiensis]
MLAQQLAVHLALPLIQKDMIKESLYDSLGCTDLAQSQSYGRASMALLYQFAEVILKSGQSCIMESVFYPFLAMPDFAQLHQRTPFFPIQIHCHAERAILSERIDRRWESGERHRGHMENLRAFDPDQLIPPEFLQALPLDGPVIEFDTTDSEAINYNVVFTQVQTILAEVARSRTQARSSRK